MTAAIAIHLLLPPPAALLLPRRCFQVPSCLWEAVETVEAKEEEEEEPPELGGLEPALRFGIVAVGTVVARCSSAADPDPPPPPPGVLGWAFAIVGGVDIIINSKAEDIAVDGPDTKRCFDRLGQKKKRRLRDRAAAESSRRLRFSRTLDRFFLGIT